MRKILQLTLLVALAAWTSSCVTQKQMTYLRDLDASKAETINANFHSQTEAVIRNGDAITIFVSALDKEAVVPFNLPTVVYSTPAKSEIVTTPSLQYYIVDEAGEIEFPVLGKLHVAGLKRSEVAALVKERLEAHVLNPTVHVELMDAHVSVLGEVARPGRVALGTGRLTILDALAAAGDLTVYGRRDNVLVTREVDGKLEIARINLRNGDLLTSPYFFLQQNDIVYVSPNKVRAISSANAGLWLSMVSTLASTATVIVTVINATK